MDEKHALIQICRYIGAKIPIWTQGAGSNVSVKLENTIEPLILIKASGFRLSDVSQGNGLACVQLNLFKNELNQITRQKNNEEERYAGALKQYSIKGEGLGWPSMETGFHCLLPKKIVIHFHSLVAILIADFLKKKTSPISEWIAFHSPGKTTCLHAESPGWKLSESIGKMTDYDVIFLENHGIVLQINDPNFLNQWENFEIAFCQKWGFESLLPFYQLKEPISYAKHKFGDKIIPLKIYFPDTAVFLEKLKKHLVPSGSFGKETLWELNQEAWQTEKNISEIWLATQILYELKPDLAEVPDFISQTISDLPSEKIRKNINSNGNKK